MRGNIYTLPSPFFVLATQNPIEQEGTYPLPEAQLDRFLFNTVLDYLSADEELQVVDLTTVTTVASADPVTTAKEIVDFQQLVRMVPIGASVSRYVVDLVRVTRASDENAPDFVKKYVNYGGSVRAAQFLVLAAKARALMKGRYHVTYEDVTGPLRPGPPPQNPPQLPRGIRPPEAGRHPKKDPGRKAGTARLGVLESLNLTRRRGDAEEDAESYDGRKVKTGEHGDSGDPRRDRECFDRSNYWLLRLKYTVTWGQGCSSLFMKSVFVTS